MVITSFVVRGVLAALVVGAVVASTSASQVEESTKAQPQADAAGAVPAPKRDGVRLNRLLELDAPIARWDEAIPLGNGLMGVLVWGEGNVLRLSLDRGDVWDTRLPEAFKAADWTYATMQRLKAAGDHATHVKMFDEPYDQIAYPTKLPVGRLEITLPEETKVTEFILDAADGRATVWTEKPSRLAPARLHSPLTVSMHGRDATAVVTGLPEGVSLRVMRPEGLDRLHYPEAQHGFDADSSWYVQRTLEGLEWAVVAVRFRSEPPNRGQPSVRAIAVSIATNAEGAEPLKLARARAVKEADVYRAEASGRTEMMRGAMKAASVTLPDERLQRQYDLCKYLYVSGSRPDAPPMALQGVWTADDGGLPPWKGDYHNNLNTQMTYAGYQAAGLFEQGLSWVNFNWRLMPAYKEFARTFYGIEDEKAAVIPGVMTLKGQPMGGWGQYSLSPTNGAWVAHNMYQHWRYTADSEFLRTRARPFCEAIARSLIALLTPDDDGFLTLPLSTSPEIFDNSPRAWLTPNSNYDQALMRWLFAACAEMALADGDQRASRVYVDLLRRLGPLDSDETGLTFAVGEPYAQSHRHFSHAMAIYPLGTLHVEGSDADRELIGRTLKQLEAKGTDWWTGYSFAWMSAMLARCGEADKALEYLTKYLAFTGRNGFHLNGDQTNLGLSKFTYRPFTLEGNFMAMQAVHEMLLQSWSPVVDGSPAMPIVRVFPAVARSWRDVSFENVRAEGGLKVSAQRRDGMTRWVRIEAEKDAELRLREPFGEAAGAVWNRETALSGGVRTVRLRAGDVLEGRFEP
jgi:alpha-L-fucosidase 2